MEEEGWVGVGVDLGAEGLVAVGVGWGEGGLGVEDCHSKTYHWSDVLQIILSRQVN